jgi:lysophospholipase L1-like esterase
MYKDFEFEQISYKDTAPGWVDGVYYQRAEQSCLGEKPPIENGAMKVHSRVWQEIEETGFGIYYYEETTKFVTKLSGADYQVNVTLVNPNDKPYKCHIRINGVLKAGEVQVLAQEQKSVSFTACMTDGQFGLTFSTGAISDINAKAVEGDVYVKDIEILQLPPKAKRNKPWIFLVSDSTVQSYEPYYYPQTGWGQVFYKFFKCGKDCMVGDAPNCDYSLAKHYEMSKLVIENRSIGARSARSFYDEGKLDQVLEVLCPGDFMFVQFAHNDATAIRPNRYIAPEEFQFFLQRYVDGCKKRGAQLVLVTPVTMRVLDEEGKNIICFARYREEMIKLADAQNIPLLDLSEKSTDYLNKIGPDKSKELYLWLAEGEYPDGAYAAGVSDKCHLQEYGALVYANMVAKMIEEYDNDNRLDVLKNLVAPINVQDIKKPAPKSVAINKSTDEDKESVTGFVAQEILVENGNGNFLLNWNTIEQATAYNIYGKRENETSWQLVRTVTREEKNASPVLPFRASAGAVWQYYVKAVFKDSSTGNTEMSNASKILQVDLR